jgi:hypothetical protein
MLETTVARSTSESGPPHLMFSLTFNFFCNEMASRFRFWLSPNYGVLIQPSLLVPLRSMSRGCWLLKKIFFGPLLHQIPTMPISF